MKLSALLLTLLFLTGCVYTKQYQEPVPQPKAEAPTNLKSRGVSSPQKHALIKKEATHSKIFYDNRNHTIVDILYGTDRKDTSSKNLNTRYGQGKDVLQFGIAQVSIPKTHTFGEIERPGFIESETVGEHVMLTTLEGIKEEAFISTLASKLAHVSEKDVFVFIHGFNVSFASALRRTAQMSYDLTFKGIPMTYSWPSQGEVGRYMQDETSVQYTVPHLVAFLQTIIEHKGDANLHVLGHSMGTRALTAALKELSYIYPKQHIFKNVILAAPDIDKDVFRVSLLPYIIKTTEQITLYASSDDSALQLSNSLHNGGRVGEGGRNIFLYQGLNSIDASGVDTSLLGHSYFAEKEILMNDLKDVVESSLAPSQRKSLVETVKNKISYWKFKFGMQ